MNIENVRSYFFTILILSFFTILFVGFVDPYIVLHKPNNGLKPYPFDAHYMARGLIRNCDYDTVLLGTSMCENMSTDYIDAVFKTNSIKVVQFGSYSSDFRESLLAIAETGKASTVIMGLDSTLWQKPSNSYRIEDIPDYAIYKWSITNVLSYLFNADVIRTSIDLIRYNQNGQVIDMNDWWRVSDSAFNKAALLQDFNKTKENRSEITDYNLAFKNMNIICEGIKKCQEKNIDIKLFVPPYSVAWFYFIDYDKDLELWEQIWSTLLEYENVEIYCPMFDTELISDFRNYRNLNHYNAYVSDIIIDDIHNGKFELTKYNITEEVESFKFFLCDYDWKWLEEEAEHY